MGLNLYTNNAWVNRSSTLIPVYETTESNGFWTGGLKVGGAQIGQIYENEFYTLIGQNEQYEVRKINFRNSAGQWATGYIEPEIRDDLGEYDWVKYQEPYAYYCVSSGGTSLALAGNIGGYYAHGLRRPVTVLNPSGTAVATFGPGLIIGASDSACGQSNTTYMRFEKLSVDNGASWEDLVPSGSGYGFVSLQLENGSMPSDRSIL